MNIPLQDTTSAKSTELAVDLEYPDDDMSGPAPTQVKYEDIMPNADILKVLAEHVRQVQVEHCSTSFTFCQRI